jgi:selenocysteine lyase/cysteine desulfurase
VALLLLQVVPVGSDGRPDVGLLELALKAHSGAPLIVGSFSAGCNVTGITTDPGPITRLLRKHGAISVWEYSSAAFIGRPTALPATGDESAMLDAIFLSSHKLAGGLGASGVLVVRKEIIRTAWHNISSASPFQCLPVDTFASLTCPFSAECTSAADSSINSSCAPVREVSPASLKERAVTGACNAV